MGPKGAFPNRKNGLLTEGLLDEIEKINRGEKPIKTDKGGNVGLLLGRKDFDLAKLEENFAELKRSVQAMKPVN
jgi:large subunit ribosomal protein L1